jgi:DnaJ homolog subfamily A member 5
VLSDSQERKWYDDHREAILKGGDGTHDETESFVVDLWPYFSPACCRGPLDCDTGFYSVYHNLFTKLAECECTQDALDMESVAEDIPCFNKADSIAPDVHHFYNFWTNFVTKMSFSWEDKYNPAEVPNRQVRRAIEKENKKFRDIARKKYNETVRALASFVRKRDPRVMSFELEARARKLEDEMKKAGDKLEVESNRRERRELSRINLESNGEEVIRRQLEREGAYLLADNSSDDDSYDELAEADLEDIKANAAAILSSEKTAAEGDNAEEESSCDICSKTFKTDAQLMQHLASKTHRKKAQDAEKKTKKSAVKKNVEKEANLNSSMCGKDRSEIGRFKKNGKQHTEEKVAGTRATAGDIVADASRRGQVVTSGHSDSEESESSESDNFPRGVLKEDSVLSEEDGDDIDIAVASLADLSLGSLGGSIGEVVKTKNKYKKKEKLGYFPRSVTREVIQPSLFEADDAKSTLIGEDVDIAIMPGPQKKKTKKISLRGF